MISPPQNQDPRNYHADPARILGGSSPDPARILSPESIILRPSDLGGGADQMDSAILGGSSGKIKF